MFIESEMLLAFSTFVTFENRFPISRCLTMSATSRNLSVLTVINNMPVIRKSIIQSYPGRGCLQLEKLNDL